MSKPWLPREPARADLNARDLLETPVAEDLGTQIKAAIGERGRLTGLGRTRASLFGFFRLAPEDESPGLFLKLVPSNQVARQVEADRVARLVNASGLEASCLLPGYPKRFDEDTAILGYRYIDGRLPRPIPSDLEALGSAVGRLHKVLADAPEAPQVRERAKTRQRLLQDRWQELQQSADLPGPYPEQLRRLVAGAPGAFAESDEPHQVIHGDLNPGNILINEANEEIVFLDFEDSPGAWLPPRMDLAFALERHVLVVEADDRAARELGGCFLSGYQEASGLSPFQKPGDFAGALHWLSLRSLCLLAEFAARDEAWPTEEWSKFDYLLSMAEKRRDLVAAIEAPFLP